MNDYMFLFDMQYGIQVIAVFISEPAPRLSHFVFLTPPSLIEEPH